MYSFPQVQKILHAALCPGQALNKAIVNRTLSSNQQQPVTNSQHDNIVELNEFENMTPTNKMIFLCEKSGDHGHLDLMDVKIANRFRKLLFKTKNDLNFKLQPTLTRQERDMLLKISECTDIDSIHQLLVHFMQIQAWTPCAVISDWLYLSL